MSILTEGAAPEQAPKENVEHERRTSNLERRLQHSTFGALSVGRFLLIGPRARPVAAVQDSVVQIRGMNFARVIGDNDPLVFNIDRDIFHPVDFHQERAQSPQAFMAIFAVGRDLDLVEDRVVGALRKKWIGWFDLVWSGWVHNILNFRARPREWLCRVGGNFTPL